MRAMMRGHRRFRASGTLSSIENVCAKLIEAPLANHTPVFSKQIFGSAIGSADLAVRQYLYQRVVLYKLPQKILVQAGQSGNPIIHPLPNSWRAVLNDNGFSVNNQLSAFLWLGFVLAIWAYGTVVTLRLLARNFPTHLDQQYKKVSKFAHFENITAAQTPRADAEGRSYDIMSWYMQWDGRAPDVEALTYRVKSRAFKNDETGPAIALSAPVLPTLSFLSWCRFARWAAIAIPFSLLDILRGRWWHSLMLNEAALATLTRSVPHHALACDYLLNNTGWLYRPLWTYEAEHLGSRILFYHYSTNSSRAKTATGYPPEHYSWRHTNWPLHLVWNNHLADFVQRATGGANTLVVGPIWFSSSPNDLPSISSPSIAVFDITPFRSSRVSALADAYTYYTAEICNAFVNDVARACAELGLQMVWKRKRGLGKTAHPKYRRMVKAIEQDPNILVLLADHSPIRLIEKCDAVISLPFTSTALLGADSGKPSCYYDPNCTWQKNDRCAHDIPLVQGYDELVAWVRALDGSIQSLETGNRGATTQ